MHGNPRAEWPPRPLRSLHLKWSTCNHFHWESRGSQQLFCPRPSLLLQSCASLQFLDAPNVEISKEQRSVAKRPQLLGKGRRLRELRVRHSVFVRRELHDLHIRVWIPSVLVNVPRCAFRVPSVFARHSLTSASTSSGLVVSISYDLNERHGYSLDANPCWQDNPAESRLQREMSFRKEMAASAPLPQVFLSFISSRGPERNLQRMASSTITEVLSDGIPLESWAQACKSQNLSTRLDVSLWR